RDQETTTESAPRHSLALTPQRGLDHHEENDDQHEDHEEQADGATPVRRPPVGLRLRSACLEGLDLAAQRGSIAPGAERHTDNEETQPRSNPWGAESQVTRV